MIFHHFCFNNYQQKIEFYQNEFTIEFVKIWDSNGNEMNLNVFLEKYDKYQELVELLFHQQKPIVKLNLNHFDVKKQIDEIDRNNENKSLD